MNAGTFEPGLRILDILDFDASSGVKVGVTRMSYGA